MFLLGDGKAMVSMNFMEGKQTGSFLLGGNGPAAVVGFVMRQSSNGVSVWYPDRCHVKKNMQPVKRGIWVTERTYSI